MSSSIFSSETLQRYSPLRGPSSRRRLGILLLALALLGVAHGVSDSVDEALRPYGSLAPFLLARESLPTARVVFAGSSHVFLGVDPREMPFGSTNIAAPGWDYAAIEAAVRNNFDRMAAVEVVVVELDPVPLRIDSTSVLRGNCQGLRVWGIGPAELPCDDEKGRSGSLGTIAGSLAPDFRLTPHEVWTTVKPSFTGPPGSREPIPGHRAMGTRRRSSEEIERDGAKRVRWVGGMFSRASRERNRAALGRLVGHFLAQDIPVVMVTLPHQPSFSANVPQPWRREMRRILWRLRQRSQQPIPWWDFERDPAFTTGDFMDSVHLNSTGSSKLSLWLGRRVSRYLESSADSS